MADKPDIKLFLTELGRLTRKYGLEIDSGAIILWKGDKVVLSDLIYFNGTYSGYTPYGEAVSGDE